MDHMQRLADYLVNAGVLDPGDRADQFWLKALHEVPRDPFVPSRAWMDPQDDREPALIDQDAAPDAWWDAVYSNAAIITQRADGRADLTDTTAPATSSISSPHVAIEFLRLLDLAPHHRVLEIGTGTGWTAAMLSWRLGDDQVTTVEVDPGVAEAAEANLKAAGFAPLLLVGDGTLGAPDGAPYDRVHVTCGVRDIPFAWVEQTRPGGSIVLPWMPPHGQWGHQVRLDVLDDGSAVGRIVGSCRYMMMRAQRRDAWPPYTDDGPSRPARLDPREPWQALDDGFGLALAAGAPHVAITTAGWESGDGWSGWVMRLRDLVGDGWALVAMDDGGEMRVSQSGDRPLWDALETLYFEWLRSGRPGPTEYRLIVRRRGQDVWLP